MNKKKPNGYWTKERCQQEANKYDRPVQFKQGSPSAYSAAQAHGWLNEICANMKNKRKPDGYWNDKEHCRAEAAKYRMRWHFEKGCVAAYQTARKNGWLDEICSHMGEQFKYTYEQIEIVASKYEYVHDFREEQYNCYSAASKHGWLDRICGRMKKRGSREKRVIYAFEFEDGFAYVGLAYDPYLREYGHLVDKRSSVNKHIRKTGSHYIFKVLTDFLPKETAADTERAMIEKYKGKKWYMLNSSNGGELGTSKQIHSNEYIEQVAAKYDLIKDFRKEHPALYTIACRRGIWKEISRGMIRSYRQSEWTNERILQNLKPGMSKNYCSRYLSGMFSELIKRGLIDTIFPPNTDKKNRHSPVYDGSKDYLFKD